MVERRLSRRRRVAPSPYELRTRRDRRTPLYLVGVTSILVGFGSFLFHMTGTFFGEFADLSAMHLIGALMVTMEARRFVPMSLARLTQSFTGLSIAPMVGVLAFRKIGIVLFGLQVTPRQSASTFSTVIKNSSFIRHRPRPAIGGERWGSS
jgi:hypothetical protein